MEYRNELKFEVSDYDLVQIKGRLQPLMHPDSHQSENGYTVRSLYFDDVYDSCMLEKENGISRREKYRIRIYNSNSDLIRLEKKIKHIGMTRKISWDLTMDDCKALLENDMDYLYGALSKHSSTLLGEFALKILQRKFSPKCIVEYERIAFTENIGNVRITFDRNISGSRQTENFFDPGIFLVPVMPASRHILEVKYDELLPHYILQALDLGHLHKQAFSKYYITRATIG